MSLFSGIGLKPILYVGAILTLSGTALVLSLRALEKARTRREKQLNAKKNPSSVNVSSDRVKRASPSLKKIGIKSIEQQFTIGKKILIPTIVSLTLFILILPFLDSVPATMLSFLIGAISLLVGFAVRPFLENIFAGLVISYSKALNIGDTLSIGEYYGTVEDISPSHTTVKTWDWKRFVIPNITMLQKEFVNHSLVEQYLWAYVEFWVSYENDLEQVERLALECAVNSPSILGHEEPKFWLMEMGRDGVKCWVAGWTDSPVAAWSFKNDVRRALIKRFQKEGITFPHSRHLMVSGAPESVPFRNN